MTKKREVLLVFRSLLNVSRKAFGRNKEYFGEAVAEIRSKFDVNKDVTDEQEIQTLLQNAHKASQFLTDIISPNQDEKPKPEKTKIVIRTTEIFKRL